MCRDQARQQVTVVGALVEPLVDDPIDESAQAGTRAVITEIAPSREFIEWPWK